ncbi:protein odr-4 homolog [Syngnathus typhle]
MGRGYIVDDAVEVYLSKLCAQQSDNVTGLVIGQNSIQRDFVVMACQTPPKDEHLVDAGKSLDKEWISEHARQVSRMLPGGLSVLGVFIITDADAKETLATLRQLVFAVQRLISSEILWKADDDEVTDCVTLHVSPKSRKISCRTFDIKDPKEGLNVWTNQIENAVCLIDGVQLPEDAELTTGQKRNVRHSLAAQLLVTPNQQDSSRDAVQQCGGCLSISGAIHSRAYIHNNKPKAKLAEKMLKRDVVSTMVTRVQMQLDEFVATENESKGISGDKQGTEQFCLPRRVFCPAKVSGTLCVSDYKFNDEDPSEVIDRLKEMLDIQTTDQNLDSKQEIAAEIIESEELEDSAVEIVEVQEPKRNNYIGVAMATVVALLASAASMLYLNDI